MLNRIGNQDAFKKFKIPFFRSMSSIDSKKQSILTVGQKQILRYCINNSKDDLGERIFRRVADKNPIFQDYFENLPKTERADLTDGLRFVLVYLDVYFLCFRQFIVKVVEQACETENLESLCKGFGERYAHLDFKPDFVQVMVIRVCL